MSISEAVIKDLLPLYYDGEVSPETKRVVEEYLAQHPALRAEAESARRIQPGGQIPIRQEVEAALLSLEKTKVAIRGLQRLQFFAGLFTLLPFSFMVSNGELKYMLLRDAPWSAVPMWGAAAVFWFFYWRRRTRSV